MQLNAFPQSKRSLCDNLISLLTQYDASQRGKRSHNPHALALYIQAAREWETDPRTATDPLKSLSEYFTTNPRDEQDFCLAPVRKFVRAFLK